MTSMTQSQLYKFLKINFNYEDGWLVASKDVSPRVKAGYRIGTITTQGYLQATICNHVYLLHRLIYIYHYGLVKGVVYHLDGNKCNNLIENLKDVPRSQLRGIQVQVAQRVSKTGSTGVYLNKKTGKYRVMLQAQGKKIFIGEFPTIETASAAYEMARKVANKIIEENE